MAYRCRAYPDPAQQAVLNRTFGCVRVVWNRTLADRHRRWRTEGTGLSYAASDAALTAMKKDPELAFLTEVSSVPLQQALRHQRQAFCAFFAKRTRYPAVQVPPFPPVRALHPQRVFHARRGAAAGEDRQAAAVCVVVAER
jgi:transposase